MTTKQIDRPFLSISEDVAKALRKDFETKTTFTRQWICHIDIAKNNVKTRITLKRLKPWSNKIVVSVKDSQFHVSLHKNPTAIVSQIKHLLP